MPINIGGNDGLPSGASGNPSTHLPQNIKNTSKINIILPHQMIQAVQEETRNKLRYRNKFLSRAKREKPMNFLR